MTITVVDIKLKKPERLTDNADGGGRQTAAEVVDGELNNLFQDISRLDRTTGRASLRKAFLHVDTENVDTLLGSHVILTQPPDDPGVHVCMFAGGSPTDERSDARNRVESYVIAGPPAPYWLYGTHVVGQRTVRVACRTETPSPDQSETLLLRQLDPGYPEVDEYVRIESVDSRATQTFTDVAGDYQRDVIVMTILAPLRHELAGIDVPPRFSTDLAPTQIRRTQVADAARYYSVMPLEAVAEPGDLMVQVGSPYVPIVPTATAETALIDQTPYADAASYVQSGPANGLEVSASISSVPDGTPVSLYFGSSFARGSLRVTIGGVDLLKDNGDGALVPLTPGGTTDGYSGSVDYANGGIVLQRSSSWSATVSATATAAGLFVAPPFTREVLITSGNRGYVHVFSCIPLPSPGTMSISYRALGRWYTLRCNGLGTLYGASSAEGTGSVNFASGSVEATLGALPDMDSSIIIQWATPRTVLARYGDVDIDAPTITYTLEDKPEPGSLDIQWEAGSALQTAAANAAGVISGDAVGQLSHATGELWFRPDLLPDPGTVFEFTYTAESDETGSCAITVASFSASGTLPASGAIKEGSISIRLPYESDAPEGTATYEELFVDDGAGGWRIFRTGEMVTGSINYSTGAFTITLGYEFTSEEPVYSYERILPYSWIRMTLTGYQTETHSATPTAGMATARWRLASVTGTPRTEDLEAPPLRLDLTPLVADAIVSGSVRFTVAGRRYVDRAGALYHSVNATTNAGTLGGTLSLAAGVASLTDYTGGGDGNAATIESLLTVRGDGAVNSLFFRVPVQSLKRATLSVRATRIDTGALITGTADINGDIAGTGIEGTVDAEMAIVRVAFGEWVTAAGNEGEPWYIAEAIVEGQIFRPIAVDPSSIRYNAVALKSIPVDADVIQVDPVRLPVDGRVPWLRPGNVAVVHHTDDTEVADPEANDVTNLGRERLTHVRVRDSDGVAIETAWYEADLDAGTVTWADPLDLSAYELPVVIEHRVEDMVQVSDVLISGEIVLSRALTHDFPEGSYLSSALIPVPQDLAARVSNVFSQATWTNEWSDSLIGDAPAAAYNTLAYPIQVFNSGAMTGRFRIQFVGTTSFNAFLEGVGGLGPGDISSNFSPINPLTGEPYFTILAAGWGSGWASGNILRFNVQGASYPVWIARCTLQGPLVEPTDAVKIEVRGDAD